MVDKKSHQYLVRLRAMAAGHPEIVFHVSPTDAEMRDYYARCTAVLLTAFNEDLGLTPMEAMAHGKPVIAVNRGGPTEIVEHQVTGFLCNADIESFVTAMRLVTTDSERQRAMGRAGLDRVKCFTWERFVTEMDDLLETTLAERKR
jgi:glycosyltransferase involved in cell wall biosynthesis